MSVDRSPPVAATLPDPPTEKITSAHALASTPVGVRDQGPRPLRVKIDSPLDHNQRGHAAARLIGVPPGLVHGAYCPPGSRTRLRRKASIVENPPPYEMPVAPMASGR